MQSGNLTNKTVNIMSLWLEQHWAIKSANKNTEENQAPKAVIPEDNKDCK